MLGLVIIPSAADANKDALARMAERIPKVGWFMGLVYWFSRHHTPSGSRLLPVSPSLLPQAAVCAYTNCDSLLARKNHIRIGQETRLDPTRNAFGRRKYSTVFLLIAQAFRQTRILSSAALDRSSDRGQ
jgi:hypothetical protein